MKISYNWLKKYISPLPTPIETANILTDIGLEVEGIEDYEEIKGGLKGLVVGKVMDCIQHPNADKLKCTKVDIGNDNELSIVCGAPNIAEGQKVIVATIGTKLYHGKEPLTIKKTKLRGELSEGMICAEDEIGLGRDHSGILVLDESIEIGTRASELFSSETDIVYEIGLTPNRIDAASHFGVARDLAAYLSLQGEVKLSKPEITDVKKTASLPFEIKIEDEERCYRFTGLSIKGVKVASSPKWLQNRLKAIGLSPVNNVVDITNFVLHEIGQPLHEYDADKTKGDILLAKKVEEGTEFVTLDQNKITLSSDDLIICDETDPMCIAGIFGGYESGVTEETCDIFLESAYFEPVTIRKSSKRHGLNTDASFRFERGIDPHTTLYALKRAAGLILEIAGGEIASDIIDVCPKQIDNHEICVKFQNINRLIGKRLDKDLIKKILIALDIKLVKESPDMLTLSVPPYRVDVTREADIIEEILRIYGYNNIEFSNKLNASISYIEEPNNELLVNRASDYLTDVGFNEIMSNSLTNESYYLNLESLPKDRLVRILNPLSNELNVMRQTLLFGGLESIQRNTNYKNPDVMLYEYGRVYCLAAANINSTESYKETEMLSLFLTGKQHKNDWSAQETETNFFQLKAYYENLLRKVGLKGELITTKKLEGHGDLFQGGLEYFMKDKSIIKAGNVNSKILSQFDIEGQVF